MNKNGLILVAAAGSLVLVGFTPVGEVDAGWPILGTITQSDETLPEELTPVDELPAQDAMAATRDALRPYDSVYGGMHWDAKTHQIVVYLKGGAGSAPTRRLAISAVESLTDGVLNGIAHVITLVPLSFEEQASRVEAVNKSRLEWGGAAADDHVFEGDIDPLTAVVTLVADASADAIQRSATAAYGSQVRVIQRDRPEPQSRYNDTSPWTVGNAVWVTQYANRSQADCTQGWNWQRQDGITYTSTAGHCAVVNTSIFHLSTAQRIGYVASRYWNDGEYVDMEMVRVTSGALDTSVWVGGTDTSDARTVVDADNDGTQTGISVCSSGANGGLVCGVITSRFAFSTYQGKTTYRLTCVAPSVPGVTTQGGDSGGPWLSTHVGGTVKAWGTHRGLSASCSGMLFSTVLNISARTSSTLLVQ